MKANLGWTSLVVALGLALAACSSGSAPTWTYATVPAAPPVGMTTASVLAAGRPSPAPSPAAAVAASPAANSAPAAMPGMGGSTIAATAPVANPGAPAYTLYPPEAPALLPGTVHDVDFPIIEKDITVAKGFVVHAWTFGGTVPGPVIRVHLGDTVNVHLTNQGQMSHSIDFHASQTAMNHQMVEIKPGETFTYTFTADYAGVWMYHLSLIHISEPTRLGMISYAVFCLKK